MVYQVKVLATNPEDLNSVSRILMARRVNLDNLLSDLHMQTMYTQINKE